MLLKYVVNWSTKPNQDLLRLQSALVPILDLENALGPLGREPDAEVTICWNCGLDYTGSQSRTAQMKRWGRSIPKGL